MQSVPLIIQARLGSQRFPNKILQPIIQKKGSLALIIERLLNNGFSASEIMLAIPTTKANDALVKIANYYGIECYRGAEENVALRFYEAARKKKCIYFVRICSDNPFLSATLLHSLIKEIDTKSDYVSYQVDKLPAIRTHLGFFAEVVRLQALEVVLSKDAPYLEHVTKYFYEHPKSFTLKWLNYIPPSNLWKQCRFTLDVEEDLMFIQEAFRALNLMPGEDVNLRMLFQWVSTQPTILQRMQMLIQRFSK